MYSRSFHMALVSVSMRSSVYLNYQLTSLPDSRQTWGLKGFLVSSAGVFGMTIGADNHLLRYESHQRIEENDIRRQARNELAREGIIATETEIRKWKARKAEKEMVGDTEENKTKQPT